MQSACHPLLGGQNCGEEGIMRVRLKPVSSTAAPLALSVRLAAVAAEEALVTMGKGINH